MTDDHTFESLISNNKSNPPILWSQSGLFFVQIQITYQMEELPWRNLNDIFHCTFNLTLRKKKKKKDGFYRLADWFTSQQIDRSTYKDNLRIRKTKKRIKKKERKKKGESHARKKIRVYFNLSTLIEIFHDMFISFRFRGFIKL